MVLSNKDMSKAENAVISLEGTSTNYKSAVVYAVTQDSSDIRIIDVQNDLSGNKINVELPPLSVAQIVLSDKPTDKKVYEAPNIRTEEITYKIEELELSQNGYPMIPLGDKANLKKIVINTTAYSNAGSSYGGGGGGLCFNHVIPNGKTDEVWASKAVSWSLGTADVIIPFDDEFTVVKDPVANTTEVVNAVCNDEYAEFQGSWWKYSEKNPKGEDITVEYNFITLVYEYENTSGNTVVYGDADLDGTVDIADIVALASYIGDPENNPLSAQAIINCDVQNTGDGLTSGDILMIQQYLANIIAEFPIA